MKKNMLIVAIFLLNFSGCLDFTTTENKTSTINIFNNTGSPVTARIFYGDYEKNLLLAEGSSDFTFKSTNITPCTIHYSGRYAELAHTDVFKVPYGGNYPIILNSNTGWIRLTTTIPIEFPKYGNTFFMWDINGNYSASNAIYMTPGNVLYYQAKSNESEYINFKIGSTSYRLSSKTNCYLGMELPAIITSMNSVIYN